MNDPYWYKDIKILFEKNRLFEFWPSKFQSFEERVNALTRFIIYSGVILSIYNNDSMPFVMSIILIVLLAFMTKKSKQIVEKILKDHSDCQMPTSKNPLGNRLPYDPVNRQPACDSSVVESDITKTLFNEFPTQNLNNFNRKMTERQFFTVPNTDIVNNQTGFAAWLYGDPNRKMCKSNPEVCTGFEGNINAGNSGV